MYVLDGDYAQEGDRIWHVEWGYGTVVSSFRDEVHVRFAGGQQVSFGPGGERLGRRVIYWHKPMMVMPRRNDRADQLANIASIINSISALMRNKG